MNRMQKAEQFRKAMQLYAESLPDKEAMTVALVENLQREDLNPLEEAEALQALREAHGLSQEALAEQLGKSRSAVNVIKCTNKFL